MDAVTTITGRALPLDRSDVDTDQIIPSDWLKRVERTGFGAGLFGEWRDDPSFVLNDPRFAGAQVLVAGLNFGTGSSREHATWAIQDYGFRAVISPRFGDIFRNNSTKIGLVPVVLAEDVVRTLLDGVTADPTVEITVDVDARRVVVPALGVDEPFPLDDFTRYRLLNGLDDVGLTLGHADAITAHEAGRPAWMPTTTPASTGS
jgi:3-isopropylmalate/(R)-2-methylmalate dehydratase small subunit